MLPTLVRAVLPSIPLLKDAPGIRKSGADPRRLVVEQTRTADPGRVASYADVCGFPLRDTLPVTYPQVLAFPLHLGLLSDPAYPFPAVGSVHVAHAITAHRPLATTEPLGLTVRVGGVHAHPRGGLVDLVTEARSGGHLVWESVATYLGRGRPVAAPPAPAPPILEVPQGGRDWELPGDLGRRYAAVSGDRNPLHLYPWSARPFGFAGPIAHGLWTLARCLATLENDLPAQVHVEVRFRHPILLPATVRFSSARSATGQHTFAVTSVADATPHLLGTTA